MKLSDCPYHPSDPRWHNWQMQYIQSQGPDGPLGQLNAQHERMERVRQSIIAQRTDKHAWHDDVMREVESHNQWVEAGQPKHGTITFAGGTAAISGFRFTSLGGGGFARGAGGISSGGGGGGFAGSGLSAFRYHYYHDPSDDPIDPDLKDMALLMHTTPDQIKKALSHFSQTFGATLDKIKTAFTDIWEALQAVLDEQQERQYKDRGWLPEGWVIWDVEEPGHDWVWDIRPRIAAFTWLQYDAI